MIYLMVLGWQKRTACLVYRTQFIAAVVRSRAKTPSNQWARSPPVHPAAINITGLENYIYLLWQTLQRSILQTCPPWHLWHPVVSPLYEANEKKRGLHHVCVNAILENVSVFKQQLILEKKRSFHHKKHNLLDNQITATAHVQKRKRLFPMYVQKSAYFFP